MIAFLAKALIDKTRGQQQQDFVNPNNLMAEMTPNEILSIKRMIELFKLKLTTSESYKSRNILSYLLEVFKYDSL